MHTQEITRFQIAQSDILAKLESLLQSLDSYAESVDTSGEEFEDLSETWKLRARVYAFILRAADGKQFLNTNHCPDCYRQIIKAVSQIVSLLDSKLQASYILKAADFKSRLETQINSIGAVIMLAKQIPSSN